MKPVFVLSLLLIAFSPALAVPSSVEQVADGVTVVRDDLGNWGGMTNGITHMNTGDYTARKMLDLSDVPAAVWDSAREIRLSLYFMVHDYSWHDLPKINGLDEAYEIIINGKAHQYPTNGGAPVYIQGQQPAIAWYDFPVSREELRRGPNEILVHKAPNSKGDDYLYLGIDNTIKRGNSAVAFDGQTWTQDKLTIPGGNGEYMVRLYLLQKSANFTVQYSPGKQPSLDDPIHLLRYVGARGAKKSDAGMTLEPGQSLRLEWAAGDIDAAAGLEATATVAGQAEVAWLNEKDEPAGLVKGEGAVKLVATSKFGTRGLIVRPVQGPVVVSNVTISGSRSYHPKTVQANMCPAIAPPACGSKLPTKAPSCTVSGKALTLDNGRLRARFETGGRLRLVSLTNNITRTEMVRQPEAVWLFWVQVGDKDYAGSRDFGLTSLKPTKTGFTAELALPAPALRATLTASMETEGLRMGLKLTNAGKGDVDFKLAFPHLAGLAVSDKPAQDYYYYPWGGGIFSDQPAVIRRGYGDYEALYQLMDLYSPAKGGGMYLRLDDSEGWHKLLSLRKYIPGQGEVGGDAPGVNYRVREEYRVANTLPAVEGTGLSTEYLRRTRAPGGSFVPADAVLSAHTGDWHTAVSAYADWAHKVWKWRPYPSRLKSVRNMIDAGWAQGILFKDGKYRTDFIKPVDPGIGHTTTDCTELMSWWDWSPLGPFMTPLDKVAEKYGTAVYEMWKPYYVKDPVTGQLMWNNQPGDYSGYNERFGGLPAFREAIKTYQKMGALTTLYTDPYRLDENCPTGKAHGKEWCVITQKGVLSTNYNVFNPCYQLPEPREWIAKTVGRVMRETGADGVRLDEVGHAGWACYSDTHKHTYQEPGISQWQKGAAEMAKMVHAEMDKVRPGLVLTTEFPGYDYMMPNLEGAITYDLTLMATPLRPLECNLQRFYFPECKAYELDHMTVDPKDRKKFWNAVESFGRYYPLPFYTILTESEDAYQGRDCTALLYTPGNAPGVYINRFADRGSAAGDKTLFHLFNASGFTFDGVAMAVSLAPGQHLFDLLGCREVEYTTLPGKPQVYARLYLAREDVGCVARLTRRMTLSGDESRLTVQISKLPTGCRLAVADKDGRILLAQTAKTGSNTLDLSKLTVAGERACVKLLAGKKLVDAAELP
ncbi:MAG: DUF6259 domain-containing protein [Armatimonadia bacterium]